MENQLVSLHWNSKERGQKLSQSDLEISARSRGGGKIRKYPQKIPTRERIRKYFRSKKSTSFFERRNIQNIW